MEIGIPVGPSNDKKERLITNEADFSEMQAQSRIMCWKETLEKSLDRINKRYNLDISVEIYAKVNDNNREERRVDLVKR